MQKKFTYTSGISVANIPEWQLTKGITWNLIVVWSCETAKKNFPPPALLDFVNSNHRNTAVSEE